LAITSELSPNPKYATRLEALFTRIFEFESLPRERLRQIAALAVPRHFDSGQVVYVEGEPAEWFYLLESGWVKATRMSRDGREQAMMFLQAGEVFGDIAVLTGKNYPGTVLALEPVDVWGIPAEPFLKLVEQNSDLAMMVIRRLGARVLYFLDLVEDLSLRSVETRLAGTLLQHAEKRDSQLVVPRRYWTTFDEMAVRLGTVRDVLSRALKTLETDGLLRVEKQGIILLDPDGLKERSEL